MEVAEENVFYFYVCIFLADEDEHAADAEDQGDTATILCGAQYLGRNIVPLPQTRFTKELHEQRQSNSPPFTASALRGKRGREYSYQLMAPTGKHSPASWDTFQSILLFQS